MGLIGHEGGGKSAIMTFMCLVHHAKGGRLWTFPGYDVFLPPRVQKGSREERKISTELPMEQWVSLGSELENALIAIDEIQQFFDAQRFATTVNKLASSLTGQRRKRSLSLVYTVQNWKWLDNRIRWGTWVLGFCQDLHCTRWGREEGLERGILSEIRFFDHKGFFTGKEWTPLGQKVIYIKSLWDCYDSYSVISPWESFTKINIQRPEINIDFT